MLVLPSQRLRENHKQLILSFGARSLGAWKPANLLQTLFRPQRTFGQFSCKMAFNNIDENIALIMAWMMRGVQNHQDRTE